MNIHGGFVRNSTLFSSQPLSDSILVFSPHRISLGPHFLRVCCLSSWGPERVVAWIRLCCCWSRSNGGSWEMGTGAASSLLHHVNHVILYGFLVLCSLLLWWFPVSLSALFCDSCTALSQAVVDLIDCVMATWTQCSLKCEVRLGELCYNPTKAGA